MRLISDQLKRVLVYTVMLCGLSYSFGYGSDLKTQQTTLYPYQSSISVQDDFLFGATGSGNVGDLGWAVSGTVTGQVSASNRLGIYRLDTGSVSATLARISPFTSNLIDPGNPTLLTWIIRLNTNDANTTIRIGSGNSVTADPPTHGIYFEKLDADTNWFCVTRSGGVQTRTDSTVAVTTNFDTFLYARDSNGVSFRINGVSVCGTHTANITATFISPFVFIINSAAAAKTFDVDYFQMLVTGITR